MGKKNKKKKDASARQHSETLPLQAGEKSVRYVEKLNAPVENLYQDCTFAPRTLVTFNFQGSSTDIDSKLVNQIKEIIASEKGTNGFYIPIEHIANLFQQKFKETFSNASGGKKLIQFMKDRPRNFICKNKGGNWRVSLPKEDIDERHSSGSRAKSDHPGGACAFPDEDATTGDQQPTFSLNVRSAPSGAPPGTVEEQDRIFKAFVEGGKVEERSAPPLHTADKSKPKVPVVYDIEESPGEKAPDPGDPSTDAAAQMSPVDRIFEKANGFKKGLFALITGPLPKYITKLEGISNIPWQVVFDFDESSRDDGGLLTTVENFIRKKRPLHICDWSERSGPMHPKATVWCFAKGRRDKPESRIKECEEWRNKCLGKLDTMLNDLGSQVHGCSVLTVLVFWNDHMGEYLHYIILKVYEKMKNVSQIILCIDKDIEIKEQLYLQYLEKQTEVQKVNVSVEHLIQAFTKVESIPSTILQSEYKLPTADGTNVPGIDADLAVKLGENLDVLYLRNSEAHEASPEAMQEADRKFFRGETLSWASRYNFDAESLDVKRDIHEGIVKTLQNHLSDQRSIKRATFTLFHTPGSGGTTTAQRVLWELKDHFPCVQVHFGRGSIRDISSKIEKIYSLTHKPVVCLIDGEDDHRIRQIDRQLKEGTFIILSVQRCRKIPSRGNKPPLSRHFFLDGKVSKREAYFLAKHFGHHCDAPQKKALESLRREVEEEKIHHLFEFGLTAFLHEFRGIQSLVRGYLRLGENHDKMLTPHQTILAYLSLVYFYGQKSLPCQFFCDLLHHGRRNCLELDLFPEEVQQLSVKVDKQGDSIRICHSLVAQEILEQVLTHGSTPPERQKRLSKSAGQRLHLRVMEFIDYARRQIQESSSSPVTDILTRIIIDRNYEDSGELESKSKAKKPDLSRLLTDIHCSAPYEERLQVLKHLTIMFPKEHNYFAHLGRFYSKYRPDDEEDANQALETALSLCHEKAGGEGTNPSDIDDTLRLDLMHIYHMYGMVYNRKVGKFAGNHFGQKPEVETKPAEFEPRVGKLLDMAQWAVHLFQEGRRYTPSGQEENYSYSGEIQVRLQICDFVHRKNSQSYKLGEYATAENADPQVSRFVKESIMAIDDLFFECLSVVNDEELVQRLQWLLMWHQSLLGQEARLQEVYTKLNLEDDVHTRRLKIAAKKLQHSRATNLSAVENITSKEDIDDIVQFHEANFDDVFSRGPEISKRLLDLDLQEWLVAIRHPEFSKSYTLSEVLFQVERWHENLHSTHSLFYLFILNSLLGFGDNMRRGSSKNLAIAQTLLSKLKERKRYILKPKFPREWLGRTGKGIRRLVLGSRLQRHKDGSIVLSGNRSTDPVAMCKGTVCKPNGGRLAGEISLDLGEDNFIPVKVFFIPVKAGLEGEMNADRRVEFLLGFSIEHGYEAYDVQLLLKAACSNCGYTAEIHHRERITCPKCPHRLTIEKPPHPEAHSKGTSEHPGEAGSSGAEASEN